MFEIRVVLGRQVGLSLAEVASHSSQIQTIAPNLQLSKSYLQDTICYLIITFTEL